MIKFVVAREVRAGQKLQLSHARGSERIIKVMLTNLGYNVEIETLYTHTTFRSEDVIQIEE